MGLLKYVVLLVILDIVAKLSMSLRRIFSGGSADNKAEKIAFERHHSKQLLTAEWVPGAALLLLVLEQKCVACSATMQRYVADNFCYVADNFCYVAELSALCFLLSRCMVFAMGFVPRSPLVAFISISSNVVAYLAVFSLAFIAWISL